MAQTVVKSTKTKNNEKDTSTISTVSLFAGCGGLDLGFLGDFKYKGEHYPKLPVQINCAYDVDPKCIVTYNNNIGQHAVEADLSVLPANQMPSARLLIGGFPCQDFSTCGPYQGLSSERGQLYKVFVRYMAEHRPEVVVAENVLNLKNMEEGAVLQTIKGELEAQGYNFQVWQFFAPDYGVPQNRKRLFLIGVRDDLPGRPTRPTETSFMNNYRSIEWAIDDLINITDNSVPNQDQYFRAAKAKKGSGQGDEVNRRNEPAYTIRANAKSRVQFHYELERRLTVRECARLQTFPDNFSFSHSATTNIMQLGNAVPPLLGYQVACQIVAFFEQLATHD